MIDISPPTDTINNTIPHDIAIIHMPYARTVDVLRGHISLIYNYYVHTNVQSKCHICDNRATARYVHINDIILFCDNCRDIRLNAQPRPSTDISTINEISALHKELPTLRSNAKSAFERMLYRRQLSVINPYSVVPPCVLCHCARSHVHKHVSSHHTISACNDCTALARKNITIRTQQMFLGIHAIAGIQQHDVYTSISRLYMALLWNALSAH